MEKSKGKIIMVAADVDFRDEELFIPRSIFLSNGFEVKIASSKKGEILGIFGGVAYADYLISEVDADDFLAVVFVGGSGAEKYINDEDCHKLAKEAVEKGKTVAAICLAPAILAESGILKGKKATVWQSGNNKKFLKLLEENGAIYQKFPVVRDGEIITASNSKAARKFGEEIIKALSSNG